MGAEAAQRLHRQLATVAARLQLAANLLHGIAEGVAQRQGTRAGQRQQHGAVDDAGGHGLLQATLAVVVLVQVALGVALHQVDGRLAVLHAALEGGLGIARLALAQVLAQSLHGVHRAVVHRGVRQVAVLYEVVGVHALHETDVRHVEDGVGGAHRHGTLQCCVDVVAVAHVEVGAGVVAVLLLVGGRQLAQRQRAPQLWAVGVGKGQRGRAALVGAVVGGGEADDEVNGQRVVLHLEPLGIARHDDGAGVGSESADSYGNALVTGVAREQRRVVAAAVVDGH